MGPAFFQEEEIKKITKINFKNFLHWANFNQTWYKASVGEEHSSFFKWMLPPFSRRDNSQKVIILQRNFKKNCQESLRQFQPNLAQSILGWKGLKLKNSDWGLKRMRVIQMFCLFVCLFVCLEFFLGEDNSSLLAHLTRRLKWTFYHNLSSSFS